MFIWHVINPNCTTYETPPQIDTFIKRSSAVEGGKSNLEPWDKTSAHSTADYYVANTKELIRTFDGVYYSPKTPFDLLKKPDQMKTSVTQQVYKLCGPASFQPMSQNSWVKPTNGEFISTAAMHDKPSSDKLPPINVRDHPEAAPEQNGPGASHNGTKVSPSGTKASHNTHRWQVFPRVKNFALTGTWGIHVFLGRLPESKADWLVSDDRVLTVAMLSNRSRQNCADYVV